MTMKSRVNPLEAHRGFKGRKGPVLFIIMDGVGIGKQDDTNAVYMAKTPHLDALMQAPLYTTLRAHGLAVGLPSDDDMGNSEVGHNALGAGRVFNQGAKLVEDALASGAFFQGETWQQLLANCKASGTLHLIGLLSDGNVHSHLSHVLQMVQQAKKEGVKKLRVHPLLDGRDVPERSAMHYVEQLEAALSACNADGTVDFRVGSGGGRMVNTMDRYFSDWTVVKRGWDAHVLGIGRQFASISEAIATMYAEDPKMTDQYLPAFVIAENGKPVGTIEDGDSVVFFNFRGDRAIEITMAFESETFTHFDRVRRPSVLYAGMMQYDGDLKLPNRFLVNPPAIHRTMGEYMCATRIPSFAISETQKYGHVTYFWNGNNSGYLCEDSEAYVEIPSDIIPFDQKPNMKAYEITDKVIELLQSGKFRFGRVNLANGDMVGHTGVFAAAVQACEVVDECVGRMIEAVRALDGIVVISADHGNADQMYDEKKGVRAIRTAHSLNPVPFMIADFGYQNEYGMADLPEAGLANVAATLMNLLGYEAPADYAPSLIRIQH